MKVVRDKGVELNVNDLEVGEILKEDNLILNKSQEIEERLKKADEEFEKSLKKMDRDRKLMTIFGIVVILTMLVVTIFSVVSSIRFDNKVLQKYDKCVRINEELFCKVEK